MEKVLVVIAILLIAIVLLQSGKSDTANQLLSGSSSDLMKNRKERGIEKGITNLTFFLGLAFFIICSILHFA